MGLQGETERRHNLTFHLCHCRQEVKIVVHSAACVLRVQRSTTRLLIPLGLRDEMEEVRERGNQQH